MADNTDDLIISISTDQATLRRSIKRIEQDLSGLAGNVQKQFATVGKSIDSSVTSSLQNRINGMVGIGKSAAKEWTGALADQGKELERLRAKYSPLFNTINNYKTAVSDIKRAHAIGAISANEMAAAISKERQAALASTAAIKGRNAALADTPVMRGGRGQAGGNFQTGNIAAQFQDIGVTAFGGMSPLTIALQQGTQLSAVLSQMKGEGQSTGKALLGAFTSILSPISLVTIGLVAGSAALIQYFTSADEGTGKTSKLFQEQNDIIRKAADLWGEATPGLRAYVDELDRADKITSGKQAGDILAGRELAGLSENLDSIKRQGMEAFAALRGDPKNAETIRDLRTAWGDLRERLDAGTASMSDLNAVQRELTEALASTGSDKVLKFKEAFDKVTDAIYRGVKAAQEARTAYIAAIAGGTNVQDIVGGTTFTDGGRTYRPGDFQPINPGVPTSRPKIELEGLPGSEKVTQKAETEAQKLANAYRDLLKSADDRIGQIQQEIDLMGKFGTEAEAARFKLDLLQASEDKGRSLSADQRAEIEKKVALYKQYSDTLSKAKLAQDLLEERRVRSLSPTEQNVYRTLKEYGRPTDLNSEDANSIRKSIQTNDLADGIKSFASDFSNGLLSEGQTLGESFGNAIQRAIAAPAFDLPQIKWSSK